MKQIPFCILMKHWLEQCMLHHETQGVVVVQVVQINFLSLVYLTQLFLVVVIECYQNQEQVNRLMLHGQSSTLEAHCLTRV